MSRHACTELGDEFLCVSIQLLDHLSKHPVDVVIDLINYVYQVNTYCFGFAYFFDFIAQADIEGLLRDGFLGFLRFFLVNLLRIILASLLFLVFLSSFFVLLFLAKELEDLFERLLVEKNVGSTRKTLGNLLFFLGGLNVRWCTSFYSVSPIVLDKSIA